MQEKNYSNFTVNWKDKEDTSKLGVSFSEQKIVVRYKTVENGRVKKYGWIVTLEIFGSFNIITVSFHLIKNNNAKGIKKYARNEKENSISPGITLRLLDVCIDILMSERYKGYSFCFYALDDSYVEKREDINRRMSVFSTFLQRPKIIQRTGMKFEGYMKDSVYIGYKPENYNESIIKSFVLFYTEVIKSEIIELYQEQESKKL